MKKIPDESPHPVLILKTGEYTDAEGRVHRISPEILKDLEASTAPMSAPLVKGHPQSEAPALGWVQRLRAEGDKLWAEFGGLAEDFTREIKKGAFKNISASFFLPEAPSNPVPGHYCLRHVAALGAVRPAVPGLGSLQEAVSFSEGMLSVGAFDKKTNTSEEMMETEKEKELQARLEQCEAERGLWEKRCRELINLGAVQEEVAKLDGLKEIAEALKPALVDRAMKLVEAGQNPREAVAAFAEFLPAKNLRQAPWEGNRSGKGIAAFSEGPAVYGEAFALKKAEYEKQGLSSSLAYDRAAKDLGLAL